MKRATPSTRDTHEDDPDSYRDGEFHMAIKKQIIDI